MRILLFQIRNSDDPMLGQEFQCFATKLLPLREHFDYQLDSHNIIGQPSGYRKLWDDYDVIIVGGSGDYGCVANTSDWFKEFSEVLRSIVDRERPLFCSCFGHQALASALGGEVSTDRTRAELGTLSVQLNQEGKKDPLLGKLESPFLAQFGHNDYVSRLPEKATNLASTDLCKVQAYRLEDKLVYATQFHPELSYLENQERAARYLAVYDPELTKPENLRNLFRDSQSASDLLPRFVLMAKELA